MRFGIGGPAMALVLLFAGRPAWAGGVDPTYPPIPDPDAIIQHCKDVAEELRTTQSVSITVRGNDMVVRCLQEAIRENLEIMAEDDRMWGGKQTIGEFLDQINGDLHKFYFQLYYGMARCNRHACGMEGSALIPFSIGELYEAMLRDVIGWRKFKGI